MALTICYKTKKPTFYNKGTPHESSCDTFLFQYIFGNLEYAEAQCDKLNNMLADGGVYEQLDLDTVEYFYIHEQEEMGE